MLMTERIGGLTRMYPMIAEAICLDAPNSMYEAGTAVLPILTILSRTPATSDMSLASGRA